MIDALKSFKTMRVLLYFGILAGLLCALADVLFLYAPEGNYHKGDYQFMLSIPAKRILWGHFIGVFFLPLQVFGIRVIIEGFKPLGARFQRNAFALGLYALFLGICYHGSVVFVGYILQNSSDTAKSISEIKPFFEPIGHLVALSFTVLCIGFSYYVLKGKTLLPRWLVWFNPAFIYLIFIVFYLVLPPIGNVLIVAGFNLGNALFFIATLLSLPYWKQDFQQD